MVREEFTMKNVSTKKKSMSRGTKIAIAATAAAIGIGVAAPIVYGVMQRRSKLRGSLTSTAKKLYRKPKKMLSSVISKRPSALGTTKAKRA